MIAYLVPHNDAHMSEYISDADERIKFISGFSGSAGVCLITQEIAFMWTDGRYWLQASKELEEGWELKKMRQGNDKLWHEWSKDNLKEGDIIAYDPTLVPEGTVEERQKYLLDSGIKVEPFDINLVDEIWGPEKPIWSVTAVSIHAEEFTGRSVAKNLSEVMAKVEEKKGNALLLVTLDHIAWMTNLRGQDIPYNPLFYSYGVVYKKDETYTVRLYIDSVKVKNVEEYLKDSNIEIAPYSQVFDDLSTGDFKDFKIALDKNDCNHKIYSSINKDNVINAPDLVGEIKFVKNETQINGYRSSQIRDGAALAKFFSWLEDELVNKGSSITEYEGTLELEKCRAEQDLFMGQSFDTILSTGANGAIIHYKPSKEECAVLNPKEMILCDSGGHYLDGTTDTTRTMHFTEPTAFQKEMYTRVLNGNLNLERLKIPNNMKHTQISVDVVARQPLWEVGLDYNHGTGHGVGHFLNVHEGPYCKPFRPGMTYTDEPGYYQDGEFGIRIENLLILQEDPKVKDYMCFENVTKFPYCRRLIDTQYLSPKDVAYINKYHEQVREQLSPLLQDNELALKYIERETEPIAF